MDLENHSLKELQKRWVEADLHSRLLGLAVYIAGGNNVDQGEALADIMELIDHRLGDGSR